jgi:hypothetical protein
MPTTRSTGGGTSAEAGPVTDDQGHACTNFAQGRSSSVVTADLTSTGHQDLVPARSCGVVLLDGRTLAHRASSARAAVQNTRPVTTGRNGRLGVTMATGPNWVAVPRVRLPLHRRRWLAGFAGLADVPPRPATRRCPDPDLPDPRLDDQRTDAAERRVTVSANGLYRAAMQSDGTLVVYQRSSTLVRWANVSQVVGRHPARGPDRPRCPQRLGRHPVEHRSYTALRPIILVHRAAGRLSMIVHDGNQWANDVVLWSV